MPRNDAHPRVVVLLGDLHGEHLLVADRTMILDSKFDQHGALCTV